MDQQEKEKKKHPRQEILNDPASPFLEQQTMEEEKKGDSVQENEELGMDTKSVQPPMKIEKNKSSKNSTKIKRLKLEVRELELRNEKLKERNRKLKLQRAQISKHEYRWYKQNIWKLNPVIEQLHSQQLSIVHAKLLTKETEYGAEH